MEKSVLKKLLTSTKFWTAIIGGIVTAGASLFAKYGLEVSDEAVQQVAGSITIMFSVLIHAQGQADLGKNATPTITQSAGGDIVNPTPAPAPVEEPK